MTCTQLCHGESLAKVEIGIAHLYLPELGTNLVAALAGLKVNNFAHCKGKGEFLKSVVSNKVTKARYTAKGSHAV
jgi:hypothetical protein